MITVTRFTGTHDAIRCVALIKEERTKGAEVKGKVCDWKTKCLLFPTSCQKLDLNSRKMDVERQVTKYKNTPDPHTKKKSCTRLTVTG